MTDEAPEFPRRANPFFRTFVVGQLMRQLLERELGEAPDRFGVYSPIGVHGRLTPTQLARLVGMPPTTLSGYIDRLIAAGVVRRVANPADRRSYLLELTPAGRRAWLRRAEGLDRAIAALEGSLAQPVGEVLDTLEALEAALRATLADSTNS